VVLECHDIASIFGRTAVYIACQRLRKRVLLLFGHTGSKVKNTADLANSNVQQLKC